MGGISFSDTLSAYKCPVFSCPQGEAERILENMCTAPFGNRNFFTLPLGENIEYIKDKYGTDCTKPKYSVNVAGEVWCCTAVCLDSVPNVVYSCKMRNRKKMDEYFAIVQACLRNRFKREIGSLDNKEIRFYTSVSNINTQDCVALEIVLRKVRPKEQLATAKETYDIELNISKLDINKKS